MADAKTEKTEDPKAVLTDERAERDYRYRGQLVKGPRDGAQGDRMPQGLVDFIKGTADVQNTAPTPPLTPPETVLADDFPSATLLTEQGLATYEQVDRAEDKTILDISGIADKGLEAIRAAVDEFKNPE